MIVFVFATLVGASAGAADNIDKLFEKAAALEKDGDCAGAGDVYTDITGLTAALPTADKKRIDSQVKSRQARNKGCVEACQINDKDKRMFEQVKQAQQDGELKRVAEMCKVLLHGKNARCPTWAEVRTFCPTLGENGDPCGVSEETKTELDKIGKDIEALDKRAGRAAYAIKSDNPKGIDAVASTNREIDAAYERLFDMRERYFACDKVYGGLKLNAMTLGKSRGTLRVALAKAYKTKLEKFAEDLNALQKSKEEVDQKVEKLTQFTNDVALDVMSLAQTESIRSSVKIEGVAQSNAENLAKVLQGDRQAMETMIKANPEHFDGQGRAALMRKKDALDRLDQVLSKLSDQGYGERLGFKTAQQEVKATLALVNQVLPPEGEAQASNIPWAPIGIGALVLALLGGAFLFFRGKGGSPAPATSGTGLGLSKKPLSASASPKKDAPAASEPAVAAAPKKSGGGMLKMGGDRPAPRIGSKKTPKTEEKAPQAAAAPAPEAKPAPAPLPMESTDPNAQTVATMPSPLAAKVEVKPEVKAEAAKPAEAKPADAPATPAKTPAQRPGIKLLSRR